MEKKIILNINASNYGSTGKIMKDISRISNRNGFESYVSYGRIKGVKENNEIVIGRKSDIIFHVLETRLFDKHGLASKKATLNFLKKIEKIKPNLIHLHNIHGYYINIELLFHYIKENNIPVIWTIHDCWAFTGHCTYFEYINCDKWIYGCEKCPQVHSYPKSILLDNSKNNYKMKKQAFLGVKNLILVTPSRWLKEIVKNSFLSDYKIEVINNGIDTDIFNPKKVEKKELGIVNNKFVILGVAGRFSKRKGLKYFIELSKKIDNNMIIYLVGLNKKQISRLPENIIGMERTENVEELVKIYSMADVLVNPTLEDNFPTVNLEALACGTPVITFNTGGSPETIDNSCGYIVEKEDVEKLLDRIAKVKNHGKEYYKNDCIKRIKNGFNKGEKFNEYINLYKNTLNGKMNSDIK